MPMPEAAIHKYDSPAPGKNQIGLTGQILYMEPIPQSESMQRSSNQQFRLCISAFYGSHVPAAGHRIMNVSHTSGRLTLPCWFDQFLNMGLHDPRNFLEHRHSY